MTHFDKILHKEQNPSARALSQLQDLIEWALQIIRRISDGSLRRDALDSLHAIMISNNLSAIMPQDYLNKAHADLSLAIMATSSGFSLLSIRSPAPIVAFLKGSLSLANGSNSSANSQYDSCQLFIASFLLCVNGLFDSLLNQLLSAKSSSIKLSYIARLLQSFQNVTEVAFFLLEALKE